MLDSIKTQLLHFAIGFALGSAGAFLTRFLLELTIGTFND